MKLFIEHTENIMPSSLNVREQIGRSLESCCGRLVLAESASVVSSRYVTASTAYFTGFNVGDTKIQESKKTKIQDIMGRSVA